MCGPPFPAVENELILAGSHLGPRAAAQFLEGNLEHHRLAFPSFVGALAIDYIPGALHFSPQLNKTDISSMRSMEEFDKFLAKCYVTPSVDPCSVLGLERFLNFSPESLNSPLVSNSVSK